MINPLDLYRARACVRKAQGESIYNGVPRFVGDARAILSASGDPRLVEAETLLSGVADELDDEFIDKAVVFLGLQNALQSLEGVPIPAPADLGALYRYLEDGVIWDGAPMRDGGLDLSSLPTFGGDAPSTGTAGVWSWDEYSLIVGDGSPREFVLEPRVDWERAALRKIVETALRSWEGGSPTDCHAFASDALGAARGLYIGADAALYRTGAAIHQLETVVDMLADAPAPDSDSGQIVDALSAAMESLE